MDLHMSNLSDLVREGPEGKYWKELIIVKLSEKDGHWQKCMQ